MAQFANHPCLDRDKNDFWPAHKFGLSLDDLGTTLHEEFNTTSSAIQDPVAFHHDVCDVAIKAKDLAQFKDLLRQRRAFRLAELRENFEIVSQMMLSELLEPESGDKWEMAALLCRWQSLDALINFFATFISKESTQRVQDRLRRREEFMEAPASKVHSRSTSIEPQRTEEWATVRLQNDEELQQASSAPGASPTSPPWQTPPWTAGSPSSASIESTVESHDHVQKQRHPRLKSQDSSVSLQQHTPPDANQLPSPTSFEMKEATGLPERNTASIRRSQKRRCIPKTAKHKPIAAGRIEKRRLGTNTQNKRANIKPIGKKQTVSGI